MESDLHDENIVKGKNFSFLQEFIRDANTEAAENKIRGRIYGYDRCFQCY